MKKLVTLPALCIALTLGAQDFHYSMFTMSPLNLNPALTGAFSGDLRIVNNYRTQWASVSKPFTTYSFGGDYILPAKDARKASPDYFALGVMVNADKAGSTALKHNSFNVLGAYHKSLDGTGATMFSFGASAGYGLRSINTAESTWDAQWTGIAHDPNRPSGETYSYRETFGFFDFSVGAAITGTGNSRFMWRTGVGLHHINRPLINFLGDEDRLYMKIGWHASAQVAFSDDPIAWLVPQVQVVQHGPARVVNLGAGMKFKLSERSRYTNYREEKTVTIGGMYRLGDAGSGYIRFDFGPVGAAFNYDLNISPLTAASQGRGAMEFMLIYTGVYRNKNAKLSAPSFN